MITSTTNTDTNSHNIPRAFKHTLSHPETPWISSTELMSRIQQQPLLLNAPFKKYTLLPSDPEYKFILRYFLHQRPPGHGIAQISYVYNPMLIAGFEAELVHIDFEGQHPNFLPDWKEGELIEVRERAIERWKYLTNEFFPIKLKDKSPLICTKILPLWTGTSGEESQSICIFGISNSSAFKFTNSPEYASTDCTGTLILSWVSMREPFPVTPKYANEMKLLRERDNCGKYNAHYFPVASLQPSNLYSRYVYDEIVVFSRAQILPSFLIELSTDLPRSMPFTDCFAACERGNLEELQDLIKHDSSLIKIRQENGQNLLHIAIAAGHLEVVQWIYTCDSTLLSLPDLVGQTPLHLALFEQNIAIVKLFLDKINNDLLLQIVERPCAETLSLILSSGNRKDTTNRFKQTLLHLAAQAGCEANVISLINKDALVNAQDLFNKTPLFLAANRGHLSIVQLLVKNGGDLELTSSEGETLLHTAALNNHPNLVEYLISICPSMVHIYDHDEQTPLHKAVTGTTPKPTIIKMLLDHGADPNAKSDNKNTSLHLAAKYGHYESAALLVQKGAEVTAKNIDHECPFDLAIHCNHNDLIHSFLETIKRLEIVEEPQNDLEGFYCKRLLQAKKEDLVEEQILYLEKLSNLYFQRKEFFTGAKILNATLALLQGKKLFYEKYLLAKLETIDLRFLESKGVLTLHESKEYITRYRSILKQFRTKCKTSFNTGKSVESILLDLTTRYQQLLATIISDAMELIGPAPVKWACMGMGSMARNEMSPYSDLEFAFLIEKESEEALNYFRLLAAIVELRVINLGETEFPILGDNYPSPTPSGYRLDSAGNTPLGVSKVYELIGTPVQLAQFQTEQWIERNIILANAMSTVRQISGEKDLVNTYLTEKTAIGKKNGHHAQFAIQLLKGHLKEFCSAPYFLEEEPEIIGIKKQLYRPFQELVSSLALFFGLHKCGTLERIDELVAKQIFSKEGGENLKTALRQAISLRLEAHLFYQNETEFLYFPRTFVQGQRFLYVNENHQNSLQKISRILAPFSMYVQEFVENQQTVVLRHPFYEECPSKVDFQYKTVQIKESKIGDIPKDKENYYFQNLLRSCRTAHVGEQVFYLEQLGELYLQKHNFVQAAKLLNCALALVQESNTICKKFLFTKLDHIERLFLESKGYKVAADKPNNILDYRKLLHEARKSCKASKESASIKLRTLTQAFKKLVAQMITNSQNLLGSPPTQWACIGMGSMGRGEMCLYSDFEFAFLIDKKTEDSLHYFRILCQLLELRIINLGETRFPIFAQLFGGGSMAASPTPEGFSMDSGGNTPLGKPGFYELIDTPEGLAQYQSILWMQQDILVTNVLSTVCHVVGDERLVRAYNRAKEEALNKTDGFLSFNGIPFRNKLALQLLQGNLCEYKPNLSKDKEEVGAFGIKKELYSPLQSLISHLTLFCRIEATSTFEMIQQLLQKGVFSSKGASNLQRALSQILALRLEAHTFYENHVEFLLHIEQEVSQDPHFFYLDEEHLKILHDIYMVLIPLYRCGEKFLETQDVKIFVNTTFCDDSPSVQGAAFRKNLQYAAAQEAYQNAVSLNPNDIDAQLNLGEIEEKMGKIKEALPRNLKALALAQKKHGESHPDVARIYINIGIIYDTLGEFDKALEFCLKALKIQLPLLGENHPSVATSYNNIGNIYESLGEFDKALEFCLKALNIQLLLLGENHPDVAKSYNGIGLVYSNLGEYGTALKSYQHALKIFLQVLGKNHPHVATSYDNIGSTYCDLSRGLGMYNYGKALEFYQKALKIKFLVFGENHHSVASSYDNIGSVYYTLGEYDKALDFYQKALRIWLKVYGENHHHIEKIMKSLILCAKKTSRYKIQLLKEVSAFCTQIFGEQHSLTQELAQLVKES